MDEFQDTSTLQMDWLKLMMDKDEENQTIRNCFMAVVSSGKVLRYNLRIFL